MIALEAPASIGQRLLWFMDHYRGEGGVLNCPVVLRLRGRLNVPALQLALDQITARHESLRTTFRGKGRSLTQLIHTPQQVIIAEHDLCGETGPDALLRQELGKELCTRIDPVVWPVRVTLWRLGEEDHVLCFNMHHLVTDGHSCGIFLRELHLLYDRALGNPAPDIPGIPWQYAQFVQWESELVKSQAFTRHVEYWQKQLEDAKLPPLPFAPKEIKPSPRQTETQSLDLDNLDVTLLKQVARSRRTTFFNVMLSICYTLLQRATLESDLAIGSVFLNRPRPEAQQTIGFFANLLVLRTQIPFAAHFTDVLRSSHATVMDAFMHQSLSYYMLPGHIMHASALRADEVVFQMMTQPLHSSNMGGVSVDPLVVEGVGNRFDFELAMVNTDKKLSSVVSYNRARVSKSWAQAFLSRYVQMASQLARNPEARLADLAPFAAT
jgi:NRPS condensation-like uncharacterized protein